MSVLLTNKKCFLVFRTLLNILSNLKFDKKFFNIWSKLCQILKILKSQNLIKTWFQALNIVQVKIQHYILFTNQNSSINFILEHLSIKSTGYPSCKLRESTYLSYQLSTTSCIIQLIQLLKRRLCVPIIEGYIIVIILLGLIKQSNKRF